MKQNVDTSQFKHPSGGQDLQTIAILITNIFGGGTVRHMHEIIHAWSNQQCQVLCIEMTGSITQIICFKGGIVARKYLFLDDKDGKRLLQLLRYYRVQLLHIEHLLDAPEYIFTLHKKMGIPLVIMMHDYYMLCPFIKMTYEDGSYCGEKGVAACQICLQKREFISSTFQTRITDIQMWRQKWEKYLKDADLVIVPSMDMEERVKKYYPHLHLRMVENPELIKWHSSKKKIGIIGSLIKAKGGQKVKDCLSYCTSHSTNIHFYLFGTLPDCTLNPDEQKNITILGPYEEQAVYGQIAATQIDFFWFPAIWPETYSYTLTIPIRLGIPCISTNLGAIASRITHNHWGKTYPWEYGAEQIIRELNKFSYEQYRNPAFAVHNTSFGDIESYYQGVTYPKAENISGSNISHLPSSNHIRNLTKTYKKEEFRVLWSLAKREEKVILLFHIDIGWIKKIAKDKGIGYLIKKYLKDASKEDIREL